jgi:nucleoside-diphosphate-sugar epimerase
MPKNILLTGSTGFIGSHLLERLIQKKYKVYILIRPTSDLHRIKHLEKSFTTVIYNNLEIFFKKNSVDTIIHLATEYGRSGNLTTLLNANLILPIQLIELGLANGLKKFINTDTFFSKKTNKSSYLKNYINSKKILCNFLKQYSDSIKIDSLKIEHAYGEKDSIGKFFPKLIEDMLSNKKEIFFTNGKQKRDFIYVKDIVEAFIKVLENKSKDKNYTEYEVGTGYATSVKDFVECVANLTRTKSKLIFGVLPNSVDEIKSSKANTKNLNVIGWFPKYNISNGIAATLSANNLYLP